MQTIPVQQRISFNNGKIFYVPLKPQTTILSQPLLCQSYTKSDRYGNAHPLLSFRQNSTQLSQLCSQQISSNINLYHIPLNSSGKGPTQSFNNIEISNNLKTYLRTSQSILSKETYGHKSQNKGIIFENSKDYVSGNKHNNKLSAGISSYQLHTKLNYQQTTTKQILPTQEKIYSKKRNINQSRSIKKINSENNTVPLNKIGYNQGASKRMISTPKTAPLPIKTFHQLHSYSKVKQKHLKQPIIKTSRSNNDNKNRKEIQSKMSLNNFCEKSTVKVKRQIKSSNVSISNIELDNSFSRYFDTKDALPSLLNRISYQNIEIQKKHEDTQDYDVPNLFMDFDKVTTPVLNQNITSFVHFDSTLFEAPKVEEKKITQVAKKQLSIAQMLPFCLILITVILLAIQSLS